MSGRRSVAATVALALTLLADCRAPQRSPVLQTGASGETAVSSNLERDDYAGSGACEQCHPSQFGAWQRSPMHRMTRDARGAEVRAPFDGTQWAFKGDKVRLDRRGEERFVRVEIEGGDATTYRVTRVIGGRTREDFAGVEEAGGQELVLPVSYVFATSALRYKGYSVMIHERRGLRAGPVWSQACIFCHNTVPELDRVFGALAGPTAPPYQGQQVDRWLAPSKRMVLRVLDEGAFAHVAAAEASRVSSAIALQGTGARALARSAIQGLSRHFDGESLIEVGIGCEACHGGCREHVRDPSRHPSLVPKAPWLDAELPKPTPAAEVNRVCARCHQVLFSRYPFTWEGGRRDSAPGGSHINSGEARDYLLGGCSNAMPCTACHDPHGGGGAPATGPLMTLASPAANRVCTACHADLADGARLRAHSHHDPAGSGGSCVACHMPRKNMGLDGRLTRYHRIGSPTDPARVLGDRPLECALCHSGWTVGAVVDAMQAWWPVRYPAQRLVELYGSLDANIVRATLERGKPHEQAVAIATLGEAQARDAAPLIASRLLSDYPLVREWARRALVGMGACGDVDLAADDAAIAKQALACGATDVPASKPSPGDEPTED